MRFAICTLSAAVLAACGPQAPAPAPAQSPVASEPSATSGLVLESLVGAPVEGLSGELGCSFTADSGDQLLIAMGFVASQDRSEAAVKRDGAVLELQATEAGGFDGLDDGATFNVEGLSVEVTPGASRETGHEGSANDATLTVRADGQERVYDGVWSCGP